MTDHLYSLPLDNESQVDEGLQGETIQALTVLPKQPMANPDQSTSDNIMVDASEPGALLSKFANELDQQEKLFQAKWSHNNAALQKYNDAVNEIRDNFKESTPEEFVDWLKKIRKNYGNSNTGHSLVNEHRLRIYNIVYEILRKLGAEVPSGKIGDLMQEMLKTRTAASANQLTNDGPLQQTKQDGQSATPATPPVAASDIQQRTDGTSALGIDDNSPLAAPLPVDGASSDDYPDTLATQPATATDQVPDPQQDAVIDTQSVASVTPPYVIDLRQLADWDAEDKDLADKVNNLLGVKPLTIEPMVEDFYAINRTSPDNRHEALLGIVGELNLEYVPAVEWEIYGQLVADTNKEESAHNNQKPLPIRTVDPLTALVDLVALAKFVHPLQRERLLRLLKWLEPAVHDSPLKAFFAKLHTMVEKQPYSELNTLIQTQKEKAKTKVLKLMEKFSDRKPLENTAKLVDKLIEYGVIKLVTRPAKRIRPIIERTYLKRSAASASWSRAKLEDFSEDPSLHQQTIRKYRQQVKDLKSRIARLNERLEEINNLPRYNTVQTWLSELRARRKESQRKKIEAAQKLKQEREEAEFDELSRVLQRAAKRVEALKKMSQNDDNQIS